MGENEKERGKAVWRGRKGKKKGELGVVGRWERERLRWLWSGFDHRWWARACRMPVLISQFLPRLIDTAASHARVVLAGLPTAMSHDRGNVSNPVFGEKFYSILTRSCCLLWYEHGLRHARVPSRVDLENLCPRTQLMV
ncbi:hypothetical protein GOBAR_AA13195 [Gossypium barbadense]|uniref:Uncharacterized protein n=1 Tax=Gossypium barbadense TaxID=3634 RepID=A0A2P5XVW6_GOSBA|nr:hypothetical protein GOBAR_AA13195 [Gossypium barbadense]